MKKKQTIKTILFCSILLSLSIFIISSNPVSAEETTVFFDDFNDNTLDISKWVEDVIGLGNSFEEINQEANFTSYGHEDWSTGHTVLWSKNLSIADWKSITISGKWRFTNPNTAEMRCLLYDADTNDYVGATYATYDISVPDEHLRIHNTVGSYEKYTAQEIPRLYVSFGITVTKETITYIEEDITIATLTCTVLAETNNISLQIGGYDVSPFYQYMNFDDIQINVTYLNEEVFVDDDADSNWYDETHVRTIQEGMDNVTEGGTVSVADGHYNEDNYIDKTVTITGDSTESVWLNGQIYVNANGTIIENMTIANVSGGGFPCGIYDESSNSTYKNLHLFNNTNGIWLTSSSYNITLTDNIIENSSQSGIYLEGSQDNIICHNHIINPAEGATGIYLTSSDGNAIYDNYLENYYNVYENGYNQWNISLTDSINGHDFNIIGGEWFGGNYWSEYSGLDMYSGPEQDILGADGIIDFPYEEPEVLIDYYPLTYNYNQLYVDDDADPSWYDEIHVQSIPEAVEKANDGASIFVYNGTYYEPVFIDESIHITGESKLGVICDGIEIWYDYFFDISSDNASIQNLTVTNVYIYEGEGSGFAIRSTGNNSRFSNLNLINNDGGISIYDSINVTIANNHILSNIEVGIGIELFNSINNTIHSNFIQQNYHGIKFLMASNNLIYNNYFYNWLNIEYVEGEDINFWNISKTSGHNILGGPYLGGNYWNDYEGDDTDSDGLGDDPYYIFAESSEIDHFPLTYYFSVYNPQPANGSSNIEPGSLTWSADFSYLELFPPINWSIECSNGQKINDTNLSNTLSIDLTGLQYGTTYTIWVNVSGEYLSKSFVFTFTTKNKPQEKKPNPNQPPVARSGGRYTGHPNERITFNGENSYDPDGYITSYSWSFGDGATAQGEIVSHTYTKQGSYTITLWVTDNKGKTDSSTSTAVIIKANNPPEIQSSANINPGELSTQLTITVTDKDGDDISGTINWDDTESTAISLSAGQTTTQSHTYDAYGSYSIKITANDGTTVSTKTHTISLFTTEQNDSSPLGLGGFNKITTTDEEFIENNIEDRSIFGQAVENKNIIIPAATAVSILLLFLMNLLVEFLSDYSSEHALDHKRDKQKNKKQKTAHKTFLNKKELLAVFVTTILFALVLTYTWVPDLSMFWSLFVITLVIVAVIILIRESIRCYLCRKHSIQSEFYIWPLGGIMMIVSTLIGNTFSLAANHHYEDNGNMKQCGKVNFTVALFMYLVVAAAFIANLFYSSIILQMIIIVTILNLFIDLFPFRPMDGYETRKWNLALWAVLYAIVFVSYVVVYFNLYP